jgi:hypothetical protein
MLEDWASRPSPWRSRASKADLAATVVLFIATGLGGLVAFFLGYVFAAGSQYGCAWETSTRACTPWVGWVPSLVEGIVLVAVFIGGIVLAVRVRRRRPAGWAIALGTAAVMAGLALATSLVVEQVVR